MNRSVSGIAITNFKVGDRVGYVSQFGGYSQRNNLNEKYLIPIPNSIPDEIAAASLLKGMTAQYLLRQTYNVKKGDTVLIHAAAGGVGLIACQWAKHLGATVIGTVSTEEKAKIARVNGCDHVINYLDQNFFDIVNDITSGYGVDYICDSVGKDTMFQSFKCLKKHGMLVSFGQSSGPYKDIQMTDLAFGSFYLTRPTLFHFYAKREWLEIASHKLFEMIVKDKIKLDKITKYDLDNVADAHTDMENRKTSGSIVLKI